MKFKISAIFVTVFAGVFNCAAEIPEPCHFDHQTVVLSHDSFMSIQDYFTDKKNSDRIDASWENEESRDFGGQKGFLKFSDGTYLEIWDSSKMINPGFHPEDVGFQDACRPKKSDTIFQIAKGYGVTPTEGRYQGRLVMAIVGRRGLAGDSQGGMFFMWHVGSELDRTKSGIQAIFKNVPGDIDGEPNSNLVSDYQKAGLRVRVHNHVLRAVDEKFQNVVDRSSASDRLLM